MACRVVLAIIWVLCASNTLPADDFPYEAQVISDAGTLRSGAGETFYATGQLMKGETVEVYRHVGTDWCAIRPASGSFSYVRADHVRVTKDEDVIEVTVAGTKTRVGSEVSDAHNVEYVSLHQGERLRRFGEPVTFGRSKQLWYKVNPPSGEFRFISRHEIESLSEPADPSSPAESENVPLAQSDSDATTAEAEQAADDPHDSSLNRQAVSLEQVVEQATGRPATQAVLPASHDTTERPASETTPPDFADAEKAATEIAEASKPQSTRTARAPRRSKTSGKVSAKSDQNSDSIPLEKMAARGGQMATEQIPQTVDALSPSKDAKNKESNAQKASSPGASAGPFVETAQNVTSDTAGGNGSVAPGPNRRVVKDWAVAETSATMDVPLIDSAWTPVDTGAPMPPTPEIVDQALGQIASLELELSRIVTQDVGTWRFESLQGKLLELRRSNSDPEVQRSVNNLWQRTQEFVDLQRRHLALLAVSPSSVVVPPPMPNSALQLAVPGSVALTSNASPRDPLSSLSDGIRRATGSLSRTVQGKSDSARNRESSAPQFAGRGWLVPVLTARPDLPRFALTDAQGRIRNFVTASPGVNLRRYMRQEVGVVGTAEPGPTGEAGRLVADRIVVLNRTQR